MNQPAFAYIRRSSYKQQQNHSVETQKARILDFAKNKGLSIPEDFIIIEDVTSAYSKKASQRKALMRLKEHMMESGINTVVFNEESRMDRTGYTFVLDFYRPLFQHFGKLNIYTTESTEVWSPDAQQVKIAFLLYQQESTIKSERAIGDLRTRLQSEEGKRRRPGSKVPFGYNQVDNELIPNNQAEIVSFIYYLHSWGHSMKYIAECLNYADIPSATNGKWAVSSIESILKNKVYTGTLQWNIKKGKAAETFTFPSSHPSIVPTTLIELIEMNYQLQETYGRMNTPFLLLNKVCCSNCQQTLVCKNASTKRSGKSYKYQYYICTHCSYKWPAEELHSTVYEKLVRYIKQLLSDNEQHKVMEQSIQQHQLFFDQCIEEVEHKLNLLLTKEALAKANSDEKLLDLIMYKNEELIQERELLHSKQQLLETIHESLLNGTFLERFTLVSEESMHTQELRLLILYFVESITVSASSAPKITFSSDVLRDLFAEE
ncbi:recombinase family protein [Bacillus massiliigorillae]|uniref:recombinase family protein n=1 Tax=Bacillus massiliigorillae TaxID=1243664 RepID=UPI0003A4562D|nr:recombinase family protein [Bacillus massiliigorillae]